MRLTTNTTAAVAVATTDDPMLVMAPWLVRFVLAILVGLTPMAAKAALTCTTQNYPRSFTAGTLTVPINMAVGSTIRALPPETFQNTCAFNSGYAPVNNTSADLYVDFTTPASLTPGYADVYQTNIPGVGVRMTFTSDNCNATNVPLSNGSVRLTCPQTGPVNGPLVPHPMSVNSTLLVTGPLAAGTYSITAASVPVITLTYRTSDQGGAWPLSSLFAGGVSGSLTSLATCSATQTNINVSLPKVGVGDLRTTGATAGNVPFAISLSCTGVAQLAITLTDNMNAANRTDTLRLSADSTATGVGVQIVNGATPVMYGPDSAVAGTQNQWVVGTTSSGSMQIPLLARYIRTGTTFSPGTVKAVATFTLSFQ